MRIQFLLLKHTVQRKKSFNLNRPPSEVIIINRYVMLSCCTFYIINNNSYLLFCSKISKDFKETSIQITLFPFNIKFRNIVFYDYTNVISHTLFIEIVIYFLEILALDKNLWGGIKVVLTMLVLGKSAHYRGCRLHNDFNSDNNCYYWNIWTHVIFTEWNWIRIEYQAFNHFSSTIPHLLI